MAKKLRPPRNLALAADLELEGAWRVDGDGAGYKARDYYDAIERGSLNNTRIADAQVMTPKKVVSLPQKRRRPVR